MKMSLAIVLIALIGSGTAGGYFFYQEYRENNAYERELARERMNEEQRLAQQEREEERKQETYDIASGAVEWIVNKSYGGSRAIDWDVNNWNFNDYKEEYKIDISINWKGNNFGGYYATSGIVRSDNYEVTWEPEYQNEKLEEYLGWRNIFGIAIGSVAVLGALSEVSN